MTEAIKRIQEMDEKMKQLEKSKIFLQEFLEKIDEIETNKGELEEYYYKKWQDDHENRPNEMYGILSEDGLYNLFFEVEELQKDILKKLANNL